MKILSPVEKSKHSELKNSTPHARTLSVQHITDEGLIQPIEHIGEEADIYEEWLGYCSKFCKDLR